MLLKVSYTFDQNSQDRCLARWPHILQVQTIPLDERNAIGVVDLRTCLQAIADCSPELAGENDKDYTVYAYDYSEPDTPLVGQGMLSAGLFQGADQAGQRKVVTGRVTRNMLAIFGNGNKETLEVRLKLTPVPRVARSTLANTPTQHFEHLPASNQSVANVPENNEWNSFIQSNPNIGRSANVSRVSSPAFGPARSFNSHYEVRNDFPGPNSHPFSNQPGSRPASAEPTAGERHLSAAPQLAPRPVPVAIAPHPIEEPTNAAAVTKPANAQSRPNSRASKRPTGKPRGRPAKKPRQPDGSTSGLEEGTDADDGPARKKRAKVTQVGRSNSAHFGSEPDSLRVAASNAQSIRSFRPVSVGGDGPGGNHLQDIPRAPTPVPDSHQPNFPQARTAPSGLRRESLSGQGPDGSFNSSYPDLNRSMSQGLEARSPVDSIGPSPSHIYSDEASPADIGSSPPVPRSALYSARSSPMPSSPVLPPMRMPPSLPDSGFMSGGFDSRIDDDDTGKTPKEVAPPAPIVAKPKPKPRRSRAKKDPAKPPPQKGLVIQEITPGPPELLPKTSIYNPPPRRGPLTPTLSTASEPSYYPHLPRTMTETSNPEPPIQPLIQPTVEPPAEPPAEQPFNNVHQSIPMAHRTTPPVEDVANRVPAEVEACKDGNETVAKTTSPQETVSQTSPPQEAQVMSPEEEVLHQRFADIEKALNSFEDGQDQQYLESLGLTGNSFSKSGEEADQMPKENELPSTSGSNQSIMHHPSRMAHQETSAEPELPAIPASDPVLPQLTLPFPMSEPLNSETDAFDPPEVKANKNFIKRQAIKQKLEEAIAQGEMPTYCRNCAALQTPTWRKIWKQEHRGVPEYHEYSEKAGHVTAINVLERDADGKSTLYEMVKKALGPRDDKAAWTEVLLCNPCGIWFSKWKAHRPPDKWEKDEKRLSQVRKKRANGSGASRSKKSRTKSDNQMNLTSDAGLPTDPLGPPDGILSPNTALPDPFTTQPDGVSEGGSGKDRQRTRASQKGPGSTHSRASTHSRGSGTPGSPITVNDEMGPTRRLLFPSPRKDGEQRVLGEVAVNIVQTPPDFTKAKEGENMADKENNGTAFQGHDTVNDDFADLFGTPPARPSTPPPKSSAHGAPFKTPTRPTPSHRPVTRSVSKSIRSTRSITSPSQALMLERTPSRTPSKTPRSAVSGVLTSSAIRRRSPRTNQDAAVAASHHLLDDHEQIFESPFTKSLNQLLSEANEFVAPPTPNNRHISSGGHGHNHINSHHHGFHHGNANADGFHLDLPENHPFDFDSLLGTDNMMPSSPTMLRNGGGGGGSNSSSQHLVHFGGSLTYEEAEANLWAQLDATTATNAGGANVAAHATNTIARGARR